MLDGNSCAVRASLNRLLRDLGARTALAQGNCQCPTCLFEADFAELGPECTACGDGSEDCCLICVDENGERRTIGRYRTQRQWLTALLERTVLAGAFPQICAKEGL